MRKFFGPGAALIIMIAAAGYFYMTKGEAVVNSVSKEEQEKINAEAKTEIDKSFAAETAKDELAKYNNMEEYDILQEVHGMTHQKVAAEEKWGSTEITKDRVNKIYSVVEKSDFGTREMLLKILKPWKNGDFSNAVEAHNKIWDYQEGTIGKATRLLTPAEEKQYIEKHFR